MCIQKLFDEIVELAMQRGLQAIEQDRAEGKRELKASQRGPATREIKVSRSDKESAA